MRVIGGKSKAPAAPNYQPIATADEQAAELQQQTANEQLAFAQQQFAANQTEINPLISEETQAATSQNQQAQASYNRYTGTEIPLQNQYLSEAEQYNNPAYAQQQAGTAVGNVDTAYTGARNNQQQQDQMYGIDPGTARAGAVNAGLGSEEAAAKAAAGTTSTQNTRLTGLNLQSNAENMMAGLAGQSTQEYGGANSAGSTASGNALGLTNSAFSSEGTGAQYSGLAQNSLNNWGNTLSTSYNDVLSRAEFDDQLAGSEWAGYGQLLGSGIGAISNALAKGGAVPGYAHGGMAIPDNISYSRGGPVFPRGAGRVPVFKVTANHMKTSKPPMFHLMAASHPHTSGGSFGGNPRMGSAGLGLRGLMGAGAGPNAVTPGSGPHGAVPTNIDSPAASLEGSASGAKDGYSRGGMALAEGGALPVQSGDPHGRADNIPVKTQPGSYVVPKSVVDKKGTHFFDKIIAEHGTHEEKQAAHLRLMGVHDPVDPQAGPGNASIMMSGGEMMIPRSVVAKLGTHHFDKIAAKEGDATDRAAAEARLAGQPAGSNNGPPVPPSQLRGAIPSVNLKHAIPSVDLKHAIPMGGMQ